MVHAILFLRCCGLSLLVFWLVLGLLIGECVHGGLDTARLGQNYTAAHPWRFPVWKPGDGRTVIENLQAGDFVAGWENRATNPVTLRGGKGLFLPLQSTATCADVLVRNCWMKNITCEPGVHTDGVWIAMPGGAAVKNRVTLEDCLIENIWGSGILFEGGSGTLTLRNVVVRNIRGTNCGIKLFQGNQLWLVFDGCEANVTLDTSRLGGAPIGSVVKGVWVRNHRGTLPNWGPGVSVTQMAVEPPPKPKPTQWPDVTGLTIRRGGGDVATVSDAKGDITLSVDGFTYRFKRKE
jgi:hypothetical protein